MRPCDGHCRRRRRRSLSVEDYALANSDQFYDRTRPLRQLLQDDDDTNGADSDTDALFSGNANGGRPNAAQSLRLQIRQFFDTLRQQREAAEQQQRRQQQMQSVLLQPLPPVQLANDSPRQTAAAMTEKWLDMLTQRNVIPKDRMRLRRKRHNITPEDSDQFHGGVQASVERPRKHCPSCRQEDPCSICGGALQSSAADRDDESGETLQTAESAQAPMQLPPTARQPMYVEYVPGGQQVPYQLGQQRDEQQQQQQKPRFVFDRLGHRYVESDGRLRLMVEQPPQEQQQQQQPSDFVASAQPSDGDLRILADILNRNRGIIEASNIEGGHMIAPPIQLVQNAYHFMQELGDRDATQPQNYDYRIEQQRSAGGGDELQTGASERRSYRVVPLLQDKRDGSVLVKIAPRKSMNEIESAADARVATPSRPRRIKSRAGHRPKASVAVRNGDGNSFASLETSQDNGSGYNIVSLNGDSAQRLDANSQEFEILRLLYDEQTDDQRPQSDDSAERMVYGDGEGVADYGRVYAAPLPLVERAPVRPAERRTELRMPAERPRVDAMRVVESSAPVMADFET